MIDRINRWYMWADHSESEWAFWPWFICGVILAVFDGVPQRYDR